MRELILALVLLSAEQNSVKAGLMKKPEQTKKIFWLSDSSGIINPQAILDLKIEQNIKVYAIDGSGFEGIVESIKIENDQVYKIFGTITNRANSAFGFAINRSGDFAGSIILQDEEMIYITEFSEKINGIILKLVKESNKNETNKIIIK